MGLKFRGDGLPVVMMLFGFNPIIAAPSPIFDVILLNAATSESCRR